MLSKKVYQALRLSILALIVSLLSACGGSEPDSSSSTEPAQEAQATSSVLAGGEIIEQAQQQVDQFVAEAETRLDDAMESAETVVDEYADDLEQDAREKAEDLEAEARDQLKNFGN